MSSFFCSPPSLSFFLTGNNPSSSRVNQPVAAPQSVPLSEGIAPELYAQLLDDRSYLWRDFKKASEKLFFSCYRSEQNQVSLEDFFKSSDIKCRYVYLFLNRIIHFFINENFSLKSLSFILSFLKDLNNNKKSNVNSKNQHILPMFEGKNIDEIGFIDGQTISSILYVNELFPASGKVLPGNLRPFEFLCVFQFFILNKLFSGSFSNETFIKDLYIFLKNKISKKIDPQEFLASYRYHHNLMGNIFKIPYDIFMENKKKQENSKTIVKDPLFQNCLCKYIQDSLLFFKNKRRGNTLDIAKDIIDFIHVYLTKGNNFSAQCSSLDTSILIDNRNNRQSFFLILLTIYLCLFQNFNKNDNQSFQNAIKDIARHIDIFQNKKYFLSKIDQNKKNIIEITRSLPDKTEYKILFGFHDESYLKIGNIPFSHPEIIFETSNSETLKILNANIEISTYPSEDSAGDPILRLKSPSRHSGFSSVASGLSGFCSTESLHHYS